MKRTFSLLAASLAFALAALPACAGNNYGAPPPGLKDHLAQLVKTYPQTISGVEGNELVLRSGQRLVISDGRTGKSFDEMLNAPDVDDMFAFPYPAHSAALAPAENFDPGRIRVEALFNAIYGDCGKGEVQTHMETVPWLPHKGGGSVQFNAAAGAAKALRAVSDDLEKLPDSFTKYLKPSAGTFNCRYIANTKRRSMHSFGAAIDINTKFTDYWEWSKKGKGVIWKNRIPKEIVDVFEKHGFIWGGRWYHYDTMHFEYRPELLPAQ